MSTVLSMKYETCIVSSPSRTVTRECSKSQTLRIVSDFRTCCVQSRLLCSGDALTGIRQGEGLDKNLSSLALSASRAQIREEEDDDDCDGRRVKF